MIAMNFSCLIEERENILISSIFAEELYLIKSRSKLNKNFNQRFVYLFSPGFQFRKNHRHLIFHFKYHFRLASLLYILRNSDCYAIPKKSVSYRSKKKDANVSAQKNLFLLPNHENFH